MYLTLLRELEKELLTEVGLSLWSKSCSDFKSKLENESTRKPVLSQRGQSCPKVCQKLANELSMEAIVSPPGRSISDVMLEAWTENAEGRVWEQRGRVLLLRINTALFGC